MFSWRTNEGKGPSGPHRSRAYVVGDVHGRADLLDDLLGQIERDLEERPIRKAALIFVGDLIDRGPNSAEVVERLRTYRQTGIRTQFLLGNHEEVLLRILDGDTSLIVDWRLFGGKECMASYGVNPRAFARASETEALEMVRENVPESHVRFLSGFADTCRFGDYLIVHAGIRPGVELDRQSQSDLRWIRQPFLNDSTDHGFTVVHGHTIVAEVEEHPNRIAIDTGAYASGRLTALVIEGSRRRYLSTGAEVAEGVAYSNAVAAAN